MSNILFILYEPFVFLIQSIFSFKDKSQLVIGFVVGGVTTLVILIILAIVLIRWVCSTYVSGQVRGYMLNEQNEQQQVKLMSPYIFHLKQFTKNVYSFWIWVFCSIAWSIWSLKCVDLEWNHDYFLHNVGDAIKVVWYREIISATEDISFMQESVFNCTLYF